MKRRTPEIWVRDGKPFALLALAEYERLVERAEDAGLLRLLKASKKRQKGLPTVSLDEVKRDLGMSARNRRKAG